MKTIILGLIFLFSGMLHAQFSSEPEQFLKDVDKYLSASNRVKTKEFMDVFEPN